MIHSPVVALCGSRFRFKVVSQLLGFIYLHLTEDVITHGTGVFARTSMSGVIAAASNQLCSIFT